MSDRPPSWSRWNFGQCCARARCQSLAAPSWGAPGGHVVTGRLSHAASWPGRRRRLRSGWALVRARQSAWAASEADWDARVSQEGSS